MELEKMHMWLLLAMELVKVQDLGYETHGLGHVRHNPTSKCLPASLLTAMSSMLGSERPGLLTKSGVT
jgi:hypothetical protein